ncbi:hypothetical protein B0A54_14659 [Friedmanniomyces endolithicus]|uniref:Uncharacterized protein n=1 Tax=Friedmanniomyces endolithicus TaxID=329885 RepID=A0A4U0UF31_9PEZI|nr:hypothetical protein LTS09_004944 [Friedmanniomyces endolithicus]TKA33482.1 hypothetical protein B0A54_14659 [Friedmanniomyces endolithicus]
MHRLPRAFRLRQQHQPRPTYHGQPFTRPRNFSLVPRRKWDQLPRSIYRPTGEAVWFQNVRFQSPPLFTRRRAFNALVYTTVAYATLNLLLRFFEVEIETLGDDEEELPDGDEKGGEGTETEEERSGIFYADDQNAFIPLTWSTVLPRTFYRKSDPEWREFIRVAKDKPRQKKLLDELVQIVYTTSVKHPAVQVVLGPNPKVGKFWLDVAFPDRPPPEYIRSGLEIGDGFVAWSQQKVDQEKQWRITRILWPTAVAQGFWAAGNVLVGMQYRRAKQALGWEGKDLHSPEEQYRLAVEQMEKRKVTKRQTGTSRTAKQLEEGGPTATQTPEGMSAKGTAAALATAPSTAGPASQSENEQDGQNATTKPIAYSSTYPFLPLPSVTPSQDLPVALYFFTATLLKSWLPRKELEPPRGAFIVTGMIEVRGEKGKALLDVQSVYDPSSGKFVRIQAGVRGMTGWRRDAKGGP